MTVDLSMEGFFSQAGYWQVWGKGAKKTVVHAIEQGTTQQIRRAACGASGKFANSGTWKRAVKDAEKQCCQVCIEAIAEGW